MKILVKGLNPCEGRKLNIRHYKDFLIANGHELVESANEADVVLVWSCGFREDYKQHTLRVIQKIKNFGKPVIVAGCLPGIDPDLLGTDNTTVLWRDESNQLGKALGTVIPLGEVPMRYVTERLIEDLDTFRKNNPNGEASFLDQFIKIFISQGCGCNCTYCSEKRTFPDFRSFPLEDLVEQCRATVEKTNFYKVMLQADSLGEYGRDIGSNLMTLIDHLLNIDKRVQIGMQGFNPLHFLEMYDEMMAFLTSGRALHLRLPIQSASTTVLAKMKRGYARNDIDIIFDGLDSAGFLDYSTDIIVGFPGETEEDFEETLHFILKHNPAYVNLSRFMDSSTIPASAFPDKVNEKTKKYRIERAHKLFNAKGIFCNTDGGQHATERQRRIEALL